MNAVKHVDKVTIDQIIWKNYNNDYYFNNYVISYNLLTLISK